MPSHPSLLLQKKRRIPLIPDGGEQACIPGEKTISVYWPGVRREIFRRLYYFGQEESLW